MSRLLSAATSRADSHSSMSTARRSRSAFREAIRSPFGTIEPRLLVTVITSNVESEGRRDIGPFTGGGPQGRWEGVTPCHHPLLRRVIDSVVTTVST